MDASLVASGLWIGSAPDPGEHIAESGFRVLALCAVGYQPPDRSWPSLEVVRAPIRDTPKPTSREIQIACQAASRVAQGLSRGDPCLVTCEGGWNRSGLVGSLALSEAAGIDPARAGEIVRAGRGWNALLNPTFVSLLNVAHPECDLCRAEVRTRRYYADGVCWVADCSSCGTPMVVLRRHSTNPTEEEAEHMLRELVRLAPRGRACRITTTMDVIPDHWHAHLRC